MIRVVIPHESGRTTRNWDVRWGGQRGWEKTGTNEAPPLCNRGDDVTRLRRAGQDRNWPHQQQLVRRVTEGTREDKHAQVGFQGPGRLSEIQDEELRKSLRDFPSFFQLLGANK